MAVLAALAGARLEVVLDLHVWRRREARRSASGRGRARGDQPPLPPALSRDGYLGAPRRRNPDPGSSLFIVRNTFEILKARFESLGSDEPHIAIATWHLGCRRESSVDMSKSSVARERSRCLGACRSCDSIAVKRHKRDSAVDSR